MIAHDWRTRLTFGVTLEQVFNVDFGFTCGFVSEAVVAVPRLVFVAFLLLGVTCAPRGGDGGGGGDAGLKLRNLRLSPPPPSLLPPG